MTKQVGQFTYTDGSIQGPAAFMRSSAWADTKRRIESGTDVVLLGCMDHAPDFETGLLVFVQTCYAGWHGMETFNAQREAAR